MEESHLILKFCAGAGTVKWLRVRQPYSDFFDTPHKWAGKNREMCSDVMRKRAAKVNLSEVKC